MKNDIFANSVAVEQELQAQIQKAEGKLQKKKYKNGGKGKKHRQAIKDLEKALKKIKKLKKALRKAQMVNATQLSVPMQQNIQPWFKGVFSSIANRFLKIAAPAFGLGLLQRLLPKRKKKHRQSRLMDNKNVIDSTCRVIESKMV